jgi:ribosomal protein S10
MEKIEIILAGKSHEFTAFLQCKEELDNVYKTLQEEFPDSPSSSRSIGLPKQQKHITVLRSPHIDKKSREQFVYKIFKYSFFFEFSNSKIANFFLFAVKQLEIPGVELRITVKEWKFLQNIQ